MGSTAIRRKMVIEGYLFHRAATFCKIGRIGFICPQITVPLKAFVALWFCFEPVNVDVCCKPAFFLVLKVQLLLDARTKRFYARQLHSFTRVSISTFFANLGQMASKSMELRSNHSFIRLNFRETCSIACKAGK